MTRKQLEARSKQELVRLARKHRVRGWHEMTKADLVNSLVGSRPATKVRADARHAKPAAPRSLGRAANGAAKPAAAVAVKSTRAVQPVGVATTPARNGDHHRNGEHKNGNGHEAVALRNLVKKDLARRAQERQVVGWESMSRDQLIEAITKAASGTNGRNRLNGATKGGEPERSRRMPQIDLPSERKPSSSGKRDKIVCLVRDPYWLHVTWQLTPAGMARTEAAMGADWYGAKPMLRLLDVSSDDTTNASESVLREIPIHGGVNNWYIDVDSPPRSFRVDIGYMSARGRYFVMARSNVVTTPKPGASDRVDKHWKSVEEDYERILAMSSGNDPSAALELRDFFEERLRRPMSAGSLSSYGSGALGANRRRGFHFHLDAELIVYGSTSSNAHVTLQGEPVQLRPDGTFTLRFSLPDGRQILPAVAQTYDGIEERTIILAIERNTKELEPMVHDGQE